MDSNAGYYDVGIVGGGLAGLATAIQLAKAGYSVVLFEKETYPFHKVCGEYISLESKDFLLSLGLPLEDMAAPMIDTLLLSAPNGKYLQQKLPLGGFGISRFSLDATLAGIARKEGVQVEDGTKVQDIIYAEDNLYIVTDNVNIECKICCGTFGKRSNIDVKWKRKFVQQRSRSLNNLVAVKYHAVLAHPRDTIALHIFKDGYCGISPLENGETCICYLTGSNNLKKSGNNIKKMEETILYKNKLIEQAFLASRFTYDQPLTISQISFEKKEQVENHVLLIGDAAGMITPLCGNGMSMALLGSKIAVAVMLNFLKEKIDRTSMESLYIQKWRQQFSRRLTAGRMIQSAFGNKWAANALVGTLRYFPSVVNSIVRQTHG